MNDVILYTAGHTAALDTAVESLKARGYTFAETPSPHITHLLLPVPSFDQDNMIIGGGGICSLLKMLPQNITIIGGNLNKPELRSYHKIDLLEDPLYLAKNANITAHCAIKLAMNKLPVILEDCSVLIIGWGRIGKCLSLLMKSLGSTVTVATRKEDTRAILTTLGYSTVDTSDIQPQKYQLIFNTAPEMVCPQCAGTALKIDLASSLGLGGLDVVWARGLPSKDAPESSGKLIATSVDRLISERS